MLHGARMMCAASKTPGEPVDAGGHANAQKAAGGAAGRCQSNPHRTPSKPGAASVSNACGWVELLAEEADMRGMGRV